MNWKAGIPAALLAAMISCPSNVQAGDEGWAALGGFLGGVLLTQGDHHPHHEYRSRSFNRVYIEQPVARGHYTYRTERIWHPGQYIHERSKCGTVRRIWEPGYYEYLQVKVWVPVQEVYVSSRHGSRRDSHYRSRRSSSCDW